MINHYQYKRAILYEIKHMKNYKSPGEGYIRAEVIKNTITLFIMFVSSLDSFDLKQWIVARWIEYDINSYPQKGR